MDAFDPALVEVHRKNRGLRSGHGQGPGSEECGAFAIWIQVNPAPLSLECQRGTGRPGPGGIQAVNKIEGISASETCSGVHVNEMTKKRQHSRRYDVARLRLSVMVGVLTIVVAACTSPNDGSTVSAASAPTPSTSTNDVSVIVLVHGFDPTGQGYSCDHYWGDAERAFRRWDPSVEVVTVGSVRGDHDCD